MPGPQILDRIDPFLKNFHIDQNRLRMDLQEDYLDYLAIKERFRNRIRKKDIRIFYPGCGGDATYLLAVYDALTSGNKKAAIILADIKNSFRNIIAGFDQYTSPGISADKNSALLRYRDRRFRLIFHQGDALNIFPKDIDIYFERAFEIIRRDYPLFLERTLANINKGGLFITDRGSPLKGFTKIKNMPSDFGFYKNFEIWKKEE